MKHGLQLQEKTEQGATVVPYSTTRHAACCSTGETYEISRLSLYSIRSMANDFNINYRTPTRYCHKMSAKDRPYHRAQCRPTTLDKLTHWLREKSIEMEVQLADYFTRASDIYYGLSSKEIRKRPYNLAISNVQCRMVPGVSETSFHVINPYARSDEPNTKLEFQLSPHGCLLRFFFESITRGVWHQFRGAELWNMDETGVTTVQKCTKYYI